MNYLLFQTFDFTILLLYFIIVSYFQIDINSTNKMLLYYNKNDMYVFIYLKIYLLSLPYVIKKIETHKIYKIFLIKILYIVVIFFLLFVEINYIESYYLNAYYRIAELFIAPVSINFIVIFLAKKINKEKFIMKDLIFIPLTLGLASLLILFLLNIPY